SEIATGVVVDPPRQAHTELTFQLRAESLDAVDRGDFLLAVTGVSRAAGTTSGRFLDLLAPPIRHRIDQAYAAVPGTWADAVAARVSCPPIHLRAMNIARGPQVLGHRISIGEHPGPEHAATGHRGLGEIALTDLAVTSDIRGLCLLSRSLRRPVE